MARFLACLILITAASILASAESEGKLVIAEAPTAARKLGKHMLLQGNKISETSRRLMSPAAQPPKPEENGVFSGEVSASGEESGGEEVMKSSHHHHHHSIDKSIAGGGVILGGLATTFLVAIFCYIRATGRRAVEPASPTNSELSSLGRNDGKPAAASPTHSSISISHQK